MNKIAAAYLRMSTDKQEYSIESQQRLINSYAKNNNITIIKNYIDEGISGRNAEKRPAFLSMISDSSKKLFNIVLIYDSSRFARNLEQSLVYKSILKKNGVTLISITEPTLDDDTSLITDALLGAMNELYSLKLSRNVKRGMEEKALRGEYLSSAPFGYDRIGHNMPLQINPEEEKTVKKIYKDFLSGKSAYSIAKELNLLNIRTKRNNPIDKRGVQKILTNPVYKGCLKWTSDNGTIIKKADHAPIIPEAEFDNVQEIIKNNTHKSQRPAETHKHYLIGLIRCKYCGTVFVYAKGSGGKAPRFRCGGYANGKCRVGTSIKVEYAEELIISELYKIFPNTPSQTLTISPKKPDPDLTEQKKARLKKSLNRAKAAYLAETDTLEEYTAIKKDILSQLSELESSEKAPIPPPKKITVTPRSAIDFLTSDASVEDKTVVAKTIFEKIIFDGKNRLLILYLKNRLPNE